MSYVNTYRWTFSEAFCPNCSTCKNPIGTFQCVGCGKIFCSRDTAGHRRVLRDELQELISSSEQWNAEWNEKAHKQHNTLKANKDNLLQEIDDWEIQSIAKIRQSALEAREFTRELFEHHFNLSKNWVYDTTMLRKAMETDGFLEIHLKKWKVELERFKKRINIFAQDFYRVKYVEPFIPKLIIEGEFPSDQSVNQPDDGDVELLTPPFSLMVPIEGDFNPYNQGELLSGVHRFRYRSKCVFFGIASKNANITNEPWNTPTTYGWTGDDIVYINARPQQKYLGYRSDMELGDTFVLVVDCDRKVLRLTNERTNHTEELNINPSVCPLPWQLNVQFLNDTHP